MSVDSIKQQFFNHSIYFKGFSKDTIRRYDTAIKYYCKYAHIEAIEQVTQENVKAFFQYGRTHKGWQPTTFISFYHSLIVFFRWCVKENLISFNPIVDIEIPKLSNRIPTKLTKQQSLLLLEVAYNYPYNYQFLRYRNHAIFSMFLFAGLRKSELLHLRFTDVDVENQTIFIHQGKGNKDRIIPMSFTLAQSLKKYLEERKRLNKTCPEFFTTLQWNKGYSHEGIKNLIVQIRKASKINFTCHKLRHTFATLMLEGGCDIYSLSKMMGHSDIKTTTIYLAASAEHLRSQMVKHPLNNLS